MAHEIKNDGDWHKVDEARIHTVSIASSNGDQGPAWHALNGWMGVQDGLKFGGQLVGQLCIAVSRGWVQVGTKNGACPQKWTVNGRST